MKILAFSDLHADGEAARKLVELAKTVDVVIGAGDFGNVRRDVRACVDVLRAIKLPAVLVAGNNESTDELADACQDWPSARVLHGTGCRIGGTDFFGMGGGVPVTPFGSWGYDFSEERARLLLMDCPAGCVLVSHSPPFGTVDVSSRGQHLGSAAVAEVIVAKKPRLVVCGHIHGSSGQTGHLGITRVINAGPAGVAVSIP